MIIDHCDNEWTVAGAQKFSNFTSLVLLAKATGALNFFLLVCLFFRCILSVAVLWKCLDLCFVPVIPLVYRDLHTVHFCILLILCVGMWLCLDV